MGTISLLTLFVGFLTIVGPIIVLIKNPQSSKNNLLFLMSFITGPVWATSIVLFFEADSMYITRIAANGIYTVSILIAILTFFFTKSFPYKSTSKIYEKLLLYIPAIYVLYEVWFTNNFITYLGEEKIPEFGYPYLIWVLWFAFMIGSRIAVLGSNLKSITEIEKKQTIYLVIGLAISGLGMAPTNIILPYIGIYQYIWVGPIMGLLMIASISYGISTLRFANVRNLFKSFFVFIIYAILPSILIAMIVILILDLTLTIEIIVFLSLVSLISFYLILFVKTKIVAEDDPIDSLSDKVSSILELDDISKRISAFVSPIVKSEYFNILLIDREKRNIFVYDKSESWNTELFPTIDINSYSSYFNDSEKIVVLQELKHLQVSSIEEQNIWRYKRFLSLIEYMDKRDIHIIVPIALRNDAYAFLILGPKKNEDMYISEDIKFLTRIKNTVRVLLERALLYKEVQSFNETLLVQVDEKTKELKIKVDELEEARKKESDMIDIMGHELRTPASIVKLNVDMIKKYIDSNPPGFKKNVERISSAINNEIKLINTLLSSAKLEGDKIQLILEEVDLKQEIEMSIHAFEKVASEKGLSLNNNTIPNTPTVYADKARLTEILNNLIDNAIKYTSKGSVMVKTTIEGSFVRVSIIDSGEGIPREEIAKLGNKFHRVENYVDKKGSIVRPGGSGLGLYVTFNLIKSMRGSIKVESEIGKGSTFSFTVPVFTPSHKPTIKGDAEKDLFKKLGLKK